MQYSTYCSIQHLFILLMIVSYHTCYYYSFYIYTVQLQCITRHIFLHLNFPLIGYFQSKLCLYTQYLGIQLFLQSGHIQFYVHVCLIIFVFQYQCSDIFQKGQLHCIQFTSKRSANQSIVFLNLILITCGTAAQDVCFSSLSVGLPKLCVICTEVRTVKKKISFFTHKTE